MIPHSSSPSPPAHTPTSSRTPSSTSPQPKPPPSASMGARPARYAPSSAEAGRSRVWCNGLCMTGPDYRGTLFTMFIAILIFVVECAVSFPWLLRNRTTLAIPLLVFMILAFVVTVLAAYLTSTTDPGIIPRSPTLPPSILAFPNIRERIISYNGRPITLKFCDTCRIWRPPRSSHCATCNNCVRRFDHHCPWLGNDVGLRNYRSYFTFVVFASISVSLAITTSVLSLYHRVEMAQRDFPDRSHASAIRTALRSDGTFANLVLIALSFLVLLFTGGLTAFHIYLMSNNVTTAESFKKRARNSAEPRDDLRGCNAIWMLQCTQRQHSALIDSHVGPSYPEEQHFLSLIDAQVAEEQDAQATVPPPAPIAATPTRVVSPSDPYDRPDRPLPTHL